MASNTLKCLLLLILSLVVLIEGQQKTHVPCFFIFGDSYFDNGNNNGLPTVLKANYRPYGIDFPAGPTGRFTNGRTIADFISESLGFVSQIPPFANTTGYNITRGVNYASGGAGILDESGMQLGRVIPLDEQLLNHKQTISRIGLSLGGVAAALEYLGKCLYLVNIGTNDYLNNYFLPNNTNIRELYTPQMFAELLIQKYSAQLWTLYSEGARKVAVFGLGQLGCVPQQMAQSNGSTCDDNINQAVRLFNEMLVALISNRNSNLPDGRYIYINVTGISMTDPTIRGVRIVNKPCCAVTRIGICVRDQVPCSNRNEYVYWDNFHNTEKVSQAIATRAYNAALPSDAYPIDIRHLAQQ